MAQPYPIVGIEDTGVQPRLEIRDLQKKPIHFSLFIQALNKIFDMNSSNENSSDYLNNPISWWQIGKHIQTRNNHGSQFSQEGFTDCPLHNGGERAWMCI